MKLIKLNKVLAALSFFACASASAVPITFDFGGIESIAELDNPANAFRFLDVGANSRITSVSYNVNITAFPNSYLSEIALLFENTDSSEFRTLLPGYDGDDPIELSGTDTFSGFEDLGDGVTVGADGILRLQFFEDGTDNFAGADGIWNFGIITFEVELAEEPGEVPEPSTTLLMGAGLAMLGYASRRRRAVGKAAA